MKNLSASTLINRSLTMTSLLLCGLAASASNQKIAAEQGFTIAPDVQTAIVLKAQPDAACDLHAAGDTSRNMRFYANGDGYVKIHASTREGIEGRVQLDCSAKGKTLSFPLHLLASTTPTSDMPAPQNKVPTPKGSTMRPGLSEAQAQSMTDEELEKQGYPARPDVLTSSDQYAKWLTRVSRNMVMLPTHSVSRSDITATPASYTSNNWSGLEAHSSTKKTYSAVSAVWDVPAIPLASSDGNTDYSAFWIGLDGDGTSDLVQAGTEQDAVEFFGLVFTQYYAWSELLPNQPTEQEVFSVNPGDEISVEVWMSTGSGAPNPNGGYGAFRIEDVTQGEGTGAFYVPLNGTTFDGTEAEWIMERPKVSGGLPELAAYLIANMTAGSALQVKGTKWVDCGTAANRNISMYNGKDDLSESLWLGTGSTTISYFWLAYE
ncbi:MAG: G1 family glutamic endopeptidase [Terriglobales bacterium]